MSDVGDLVFSGEHLRATLFNGDAARLLVTFSFREQGRKDFNPVSLSQTAFTRGFAQLCIATCRNDWFINPDTLALDKVLKILGPHYDAVHMLGFSMGGYGAFRFARSARAKFATAISPQFSIHPDVVPLDPRFHGDAQNFDPKLGDLVTYAKPGLQGVIVADPFRSRDLINAQMITEIFPRIQIARLGFGGHPATALLRRAGKSGIVQRMALNDPPRAAPIIAEHREARLDDADYMRDLMDRLDQRAARD
tara:strand:- start:3340 stop:4092 length:753 start_codon:yes stop_codon:yes gene_type:complete